MNRILVGFIALIVLGVSLLGLLRVFGVITSASFQERSGTLVLAIIVLAGAAFALKALGGVGGSSNDDQKPPPL